jgi:hypothetical protein
LGEPFKWYEVPVGGGEIKKNQRLKCKMQNCGGPSGGLLFVGG